MLPSPARASSISPSSGISICSSLAIWRRRSATVLARIDPTLVDTAHDVLAGQPGVLAVRRVRMRWVGHRLEADAELDVDPGLSLTDAHRVAHGAEHELAHAIPKLHSVIVHAYPSHETAVSS